MRDKKGQLDAFLDVELVLGNTEVGGPPAEERSLDATLPSDASARPDGPGLDADTRLGKYQLVKLLGAGGMGAVWDARDTELDRRIALKVLRRGTTGDATARVRLVREARAMARLHHPNVITVYDAATLGGRDVIAMELIEGETLASWLARGHTPDERVSALLAAGRGLAAAHAAGLVHRDFKPHNVLVDRDGRVCVTDFGLARAIADPPSADGGPAPTAPTAPRDELLTVPDRPRTQRAVATQRSLGALESPLTATGTVLGTPAYMAPEQLSGAAADERADQFSFCVSLWEALAGQRPFPGDTLPAIAEAVMGGPPRDATRIPRRLRPILLRGLALDPAARWPSLDALLAATRRAWRRPRRIAGAAAVAIAVAGGALGAHHLLARRGRPWQPEIVDLPVYEENGDSLAISPDGRTLAYSSDREQSNVFRIYLEPLTGGQPRAITPPGQSFIAPRWTRDGTAMLLTTSAVPYHIVRQPLAGGPPRDLGPGFEADDCGDAVAIAQDDDHGQLWLQHADGARTLLVDAADEFVLHPRCDPRGQDILYVRGKSPNEEPPIDDVFVVDRAGRQRQLTRRHAATDATWVPDGRSIVFSAQAHGKIQLFELALAGGPAHLLTPGGDQLAPDVSPDGRTLAFEHDETSRIAVFGGGGHLRKLSARQESLMSIAPTADGTEVLVEDLRAGTGGSEIVAISSRDATERVLVAGAHPFLSFDGSRVLFTPTGSPPRLQSIPRAGGAVTTLAVLPGLLEDGTAGPDAIHVQVSHRGKDEVWRVTPDGRVAPDPAGGLVFAAPRGGWRAVRTFDKGFHFRLIAPDGTPRGAPILAESSRATWLDDHRFAYAQGGAFHVIDVTTGAEVATVPGPDWGENAILAPDGVHWYDLEVVGHVTRHLLVNFGDRPWRD